MPTPTLLAIANSFGNVDVRQPLSKRYVHVRGQRLTLLCDKLGIRYAKALVGFDGEKRYGYRPVLDGVVVAAGSAGKLIDAVREVQKRASDPKRIKANERAKERRAEKKQQVEDHLLEKGINPRSRTAKWLRRGNIDIWEARLVAFKTKYRHEYTDYDVRLQFAREVGLPWEDRKEEARLTASEDQIPDTWSEYLAKYEFDDCIGRRLASVLRDPEECHPVWFMKAKLACEKYGPTDLTYELIRDLIDQCFEDASH